MLSDDLEVNRGNTKGLFIVLFFRVSHFFSSNQFLRMIGFPIRFLYRLIVIWGLGCDIPDRTKIGKGLMVFHGQGLVVSCEAKLGDFVVLRQNTTIGNAKANGPSPEIHNNVDVGANSVVIGDVIVGSGSSIGAGSVVLSSVPPNVLVAGNPAIFKKQLG
jgi:putative colanic acid biosynthesis acetyltransferase WcaB